MVFKYGISDRLLLKNIHYIVTPSYLHKKNRLLYPFVFGLSYETCFSQWDVSRHVQTGV